MKKKKKSGKGSARVLPILIAIVATILVVLLLLLFFEEQGSETGLFGVFDRLIGSDGTERFTPVYDTDVEVYTRDSAAATTLEEDAEECVLAYFTLYYGALGKLETDGLSQVFTGNSESYLFAKAELELLSGMRKEKALTYSKCRVGVRFESAVTTTGGICEIFLTENFRTTFNGCDKPSSISGVSHSFILEKEYGKWLIKKHSSDSRTEALIRNAYLETIEKAGYFENELTYSYIPKYLDAVIPSLLSANENDATTETLTAEYQYDREAAVDYAHSWIDAERHIRNIAAYGTYDDNSANFTAQCLFAGGIDMDAQGDSITQWKWFGNTLNNKREKSGYSLSWISCPAFYNYAAANTGFGLVSDCDAKMTDAENGDIVQFLYNDEAVYQAVVTGHADCGILLTGNTPDIIDFPMCALPYSNSRLIRIYGFNSSNLSR